MDVHGDGSFAEAEVRVEEGAAGVEVVPTEVEGGIGHRVVFWIGVLEAVDDGGDAGGVAGFGDVGEPFVALGEFVGDVDVGEAPESGFFGFYGIADHALAGFELRGIDACGEEEVGDAGCGEVFFAFEEGVVQNAGVLQSGDAEEGEFGIDGGVVAAGDGIAGWWRRGVFGFWGWEDAEWDAADGNEDANLVFDGEEDAVGVTAALPPGFGLEVFDEGIAEGGLELGACDVLSFGERKADEVFLRDVACGAVGFGEFCGFGEVRVEEDGDLLRGDRCGVDGEPRGEEDEAGDPAIHVGDDEVSGGSCKIGQRNAEAIPCDADVGWER